MDESLIVGFRAGYTTTMRKQMKISRFLKTSRRHLKKWLRVFRQLRPLGHMKGIAMKFMDKLSSSLGGLSLWRIGNGVAALLLALTLAACGGGGGGGTGTKPADPPASSPVNPPDPPASSPVNPPDPPASSPTNPPTFSVSGSGYCDVPGEQKSCQVTLNFKASGLTNPTYQVAGEASAPLDSTKSTLKISLNGEVSKEVTFANGDGTVLGNSVVESTCSLGTSWDGSWTMCRTILNSYKDYVVALWSLRGTPFSVTKGGAKEIVNKTPWQLPTATPFFCGLRKANNPDQWGYIHASCQDSDTYKERPVMINPQTGELTLSSPIPPDSPDYVVGDPADYLYAETYDPAYPNWESKARVSDGWYFANGSGPDQGSIHFLSDKGLDSLVSPGTIETMGNVKVLQTFNHVKP